MAVRMIAIICAVDNHSIGAVVRSFYFAVVQIFIKNGYFVLKGLKKHKVKTFSAFSIN
jgi:hypothetical protein